MPTTTHDTPRSERTASDAPPAEPAHTDDASRRETRIAAGLVIACLLITAVFGQLSPRGVLQFDDLTHYLYAKWAWTWPAYLLDAWGRPGFTALYFIPARFGWPACRLLSAALMAGSAWFAFRIAQRMGLRHAWGVVLFCYAQPLFFQLSETTLTETPLTFYLTFAVFLALSGRWSLSAAVLSIGLVTRHEAIIFLPVWAWLARKQRIRLVRLWPLLLAPLLVNLLAVAADLRPALVSLLEPRATTQYGFGGWLTFVARSLHAWGPAVAVLIIVGIRPMARRPGGLMPVLVVAVFFGAQTVIRALGLFGSGGYARFLVPIGPLAAIAALEGWHRLRGVGRDDRRRALILAAGAMLFLWVSMERELVLIARGAAAGSEVVRLAEARRAVEIMTVLFTLLVLAELRRWRTSFGTKRNPALVPTALVVIMGLTCFVFCRPLPPPREAPLIARMMRDLAAKGLGGREIISANIWIDDVTRRELPPRRPSVREQLQLAPLGTLFAWERQFAASEDHKLSLAEFLESPAFRLVLRTPPRAGAREPYLTVFEKVGPWGPRPLGPPIQTQD